MVYYFMALDKNYQFLSMLKSLCGIAAKTVIPDKYVCHLGGAGGLNCRGERRSLIVGVPSMVVGLLKN